MSRRTAAGLLAVVLAGVFVVLAARQPVHYVTFRPGPTLNVLGQYDGKPIIKVSGHPVYRDKGGLRMVTVYAGGPGDEIDLVRMVQGWIDPDIAVIPSSIYTGQTDETVHQQSAEQMASSQDNATAAALGVLGVGYRTEVVVDSVDPKGASVGKLAKGDVLLAVAGQPVTDPTTMIDRTRAIAPGTPTEIRFRRGSQEKTVTVTTKPAPDDPKASRVGVGIRPDYVFPFDVDVQLPETIGGPSAGMMFALAIYDVLTPGSLTGGRDIAGSGKITPDGTVGAIGGIGQKLAGAQHDGAKLFLVAADNCAEAARSHYDRDKMRLVKVQTLEQAIADVEAWRKDPDAKLTGCGS
jgi:PDZ domain-containing protein